LKNLILLILLIIILIPSGYSQPCLPQGITFSTQAQIDSFQLNYPNCSEIQGNVVISDSHSGSIVNLYGLSSITSIGGWLYITNNKSLLNLTGLNSLKSIGLWLDIYGNLALASLSGLENLKTIGSDLTIGDFFQGWNRDLRSISGLMSLDSIGGSLTICYNPVLHSLSGLNNISYIGGSFSIDIHDSLTDLTTFNKLYSIGGSLHLQDNKLLTNLTGFDSLNNIGGTLQIWFNNSIENLNGLNNLKTIGAHIKIRGNKSLENLSGLEEVNSISGIIHIEDNIALQSLYGLDNINSNSIAGLTIEYNTSLSSCHVKSICDYLLAPISTVTISTNANGCNNQGEVEDSCNTIGVSEINPENEFSIYPNPTQDELYISLKNEIIINEVNIYNQIGQKVFHAIQLSNPVDVSMLRPGLYIIVFISTEFTIRKKLIIK